MGKWTKRLDTHIEDTLMEWLECAIREGKYANKPVAIESIIRSVATPEELKAAEERLTKRMEAEIASRRKRLGRAKS